MSAGILDGFQTIIPTAAVVLSEKRQILRLTQQEVADRAKITLRQYQRLESGERNILTSSFGLACRVIEALDMDVSKFYHGDYYLEEEVKTMRGKGIASRKKSSILVVVGHVYLNRTVRDWLYSFHTPLFFLAAGWVYKEKPILTDIKRRIQTIVVPYFSFGLLVLLYWQVIERRFRDSDMSFTESLIGLFSGSYNNLDFNG